MSYRRWSRHEEARLTRLYREGLTLRLIAEALGRTQPQVRHKASAVGLADRWKPRRPDFLAAVTRLHAAGAHDWAVAFELGCSYKTVRRARARLGLARNPPPGRAS